MHAGTGEHKLWKKEADFLRSFSADSRQSVEIDLQEEILLVFPSTLTTSSAESWSGDQKKIKKAKEIQGFLITDVKFFFLREM